MKSSLSKHNDDVPYKWTGREFSAAVSMICELEVSAVSNSLIHSYCQTATVAARLRAYDII